MACEDVRAAVSAALDGEAEVDVDHLSTCAECARFERAARRLRAALRFEVVDAPPDVTARVVTAVASQEPTARRRLLPVAAAFVAGIVAGAATLWPGGGAGIAAAALPARIVAAQHDVASLVADLTVVEHAPRRVRTGVLRYRAPDHLELQLGDTALRAGGDRWRLEQAGTTTERSGVEPFAGDGPVPLDLVLPAAGFVGAGTPELLGVHDVDGRTAIGVRATAAQVTALLSGLRPGGDGREVHPTDAVELWLDEDHLVPLRVVVRAAAGPDRSRWAARRGHDERAGEVVLEARLERVVVNDARTVDDLDVPAVAAGAPDGGFRPGAAGVPEPAWLPAGMTGHLAGTVGDVAVRTWTDGRAWVKVRATAAWAGSRLFGGLGPVVRAVALGDGIGYAAEDGTAVAVHGAETDLVVTGSVAGNDLRRIAASLGVVGLPVPAGWPEHATADLATLVRRVPDHLLLPADAWPGAPAVRIDDHTTVLVHAGPGDRAVVLASRDDDTLSPPFDPDATGVVVRGRTGRWSPSRGELEWVEGGRLWTLRSTTVGLPELVALAAALERRG